MNKKVVFLTGGTGVMGTEAIKKFLEHTDEFEVRALIRRSEKNRAKVEAFGGELNVVWGDLTDWDLLERSMEGVDYVLHIGALLNPLCTDYPPEVTLKTNYGSTLAMLRGISLCLFIYFIHYFPPFFNTNSYQKKTFSKAKIIAISPTDKTAIIHSPVPILFLSSFKNLFMYDPYIQA